MTPIHIYIQNHYLYTEPFKKRETVASPDGSRPEPALSLFSERTGGLPTTPQRMQRPWLRTQDSSQTPIPSGDTAETVRPAAPPRPATGH
jgi:hypothetical protein